MKKLWPLMLALTFCLPAHSVVIGSVDTQKVLAEIPDGKKASDEVKNFAEKKENELKQQFEAFEKERINFEKQSLVMNAQAKAKKEGKLREELQKLETERRKMVSEIQQFEQEKRRPLIDKIKKVIADVSKKNGVQLTVGLGGSPFLYAESEKDITDEVIKAYKQAYK